MAIQDTVRIVLSSQPAHVRVGNTLRTLRRLPLIPVSLLLLLVVTGIFAPLIAPHDPIQGSLRDHRLPPAWAKGGNTEFLLGTDQFGRDVLSRTVYGARVSLIVAVVTLGIGGTIGTLLGLISGYYGGLLDELIMRLVDIKLSIPLILLALVLVLTFGQSFGMIIIVLVLYIWVRFARQIRGEVLQLKNMDYVALAKVSGASTPRILFKHIFPGTINTLIVVSTLQVGFVILVESTLSFLGAGVPPPNPAWGSMVADGRDHLAVAWWISTMPGLAILLTVMSMNLFGDWLRDKLDPRLRQLD